jgi:hypothetical protein
MSVADRTLAAAKARRLRSERGVRAAALLLRALGVPLPMALLMLGIEPSAPSRS